MCMIIVKVLKRFLKRQEKAWLNEHKLMWINLNQNPAYSSPSKISFQREIKQVRQRYDVENRSQ